MDEQAMRQAIVEIGRRLYERGYIAAGDGNISVRLLDGRVVATPTGVCKGYLTPDMMVIVDGQGRKVRGHLDPSSELAMHMVIYRLRPDVNAVVHAHPPCGTGFAAAGVALTKPLISEVVLTLGCIPLAEYGTPTTTELAQAITPYVPHYDALLLANHGALTCGSDLENAYFKMETLEHFARVSLVARLVGGEKPLAPDAVEKLFRIREQAGFTSPTPTLCQVQAPPLAKQPTGDEHITLTRQQLVELIAESVELFLRALAGRRT
ncbi:MAG: class II aldolase/adducin family protein [Acidobacteria bacterium]|nr:class II aldolase/adducin family protein [Acidobacteriota bacterium]